jgi:F0F1-type ATP synthase membrane subunit c/vacuolar-type H+-ATPase subunit K
VGEVQDDAAAAAGGAPQREAGDLSSVPGDPGDSDDSSAAGDLIEQIGAEIDRRLDARLAALRLTGAATTVTAPALPADAAAAGATGSPREATAAPGADPAPRRRAGAGRSPWQSLWIGIMIGSAVTGAAAIAQGVLISTDANQEMGSPGPFVNASWIIFEALAGVWVLLFVIYIVQLVVGHARDRRR